MIRTVAENQHNGWWSTGMLLVGSYGQNLKASVASES